jgi:hypothetical protein
MKFSIGLSVGLVLALCASCLKSPEPKKPLEPNIESPDYEVNFVNGVEPINVKPGKIVCPLYSELRILDSKNSAYCYPKKKLVKITEDTTISKLNTQIICPNKIIVSSSDNIGICKTN